MEQIPGCLINVLSKLKESSKEAVDNIESFNEFKDYMHISREVEMELTGLIKNAQNLNKRQLILVCGSVGDGKSHLLSYLKNKNSQINDHFYIHNDATESSSPEKTSNDTLNDILINFSDGNLESDTLSQQHILLAINLGTLNNFLHSKYGSQYKLLKEYVSSKHILEPATVGENSFDWDSNFQFVNLSDYHMISLTSEGPISDFIEMILQKIIARDKKNPFYTSYENDCIKCEVVEICPIKYNYELLMIEKVREQIINFIAELSLKYKTIISTRSLLNFIYNIIVENEFEQQKSVEDIKEYISDMSIEQTLISFMPNLYFDFGQVSEVFRELPSIDPSNRRSETLDHLTITFYNTNNISDIFQLYVNKKMPIHKIMGNKLNQLENKHERTLALKTLIRYYAFYPNEDSNLDIHDQIYNSYTRYLYHWNKGNKSDLVELYNSVIKSIYEWNGRSDAGRINIYPGRNQLKYTISQSLEIKSYAKEIKEKEDIILKKFIPYLILQFREANKHNILKIQIDFPLYELLMKINEGYRPNKQDKNNFINFEDFINNIVEYGDQEERIQLLEKIGRKLKRYELNYQEDFDHFEFKEI